MLPYFVALVGLVLAVAAGPVEARGTITEPPSSSATVVVALVDELDGGPEVSAVVIRRAAAEPRDVILLRRSEANGARLAPAVAMLMLQRVGEVSVRQDVRTRISGAVVPVSWRADWLPRFESLVARLKRADPRGIPGIGMVPAETLVLPSAAATSRLTQ
jgi:hypothetical protein